jgi:hypothetical protein
MTVDMLQYVSQMFLTETTLKAASTMAAVDQLTIHLVAPEN